MDNNKNKDKSGKNLQNGPAPHNDQLGENAGEGRIIKAQDNKKRK